MNKELYVYQHLGLGDHIICNGLIRNICKRVEKVNLFCKPHNVESVGFMFRDIHNLSIVKADDKDAQNILKNVPQETHLVIGHQYLDCIQNYDKFFYHSVGLDFDKRWSDFYILRDNKREQELYDKFEIKGDYIFIHEDTQRNFNIDKTHIPQNVQVVTPDIRFTNNIFDYLKIIENATEIHVIDSSFKHIIESIEVKSKKLYYHKYARLYNDNFLYNISKKNWIVL